MNKKISVERNEFVEKEQFEKYLQKIEDPNYESETNFALPENATPLEKSKYDICEKIVSYKQDNNLSIENIAQKVALSKAEVEDILHYHIDYFTLDRLVDYACKLLAPKEEVKVTVEERRV